jgi:DNA-directed RNA polymerase specialized sigma24 family protein
MRPDCAAAARDSVPPDALLVHRIAALSDKPALAELYQRHGLTLYALAYSIVLDGEAADTAVGLAFREVWRGAASFDERQNSVGRWLAELTRRAAEQCLAVPSGADRTAPSRTPRVVAALPLPSQGHAREPREATRWGELVRVAASVVLPALLLE